MDFGATGPVPARAPCVRGRPRPGRDGKRGGGKTGKAGKGRKVEKKGLRGGKG
ncbi:hypothetical protein STXM2123_4515 [Streptomyces sp. F-3]|nr:hypothetical protein STXM2123_4515 [Streptomyces sp. F-3]